MNAPEKRKELIAQEYEYVISSDKVYKCIPKGKRIIRFNDSWGDGLQSDAHYNGKVILNCNGGNVEFQESGDLGYSTSARFGGTSCASPAPSSATAIGLSPTRVITTMSLAVLAMVIM